jgi:hypothetical protein
MRVLEAKKVYIYINLSLERNIALHYKMAIRVLRVEAIVSVVQCTAMRSLGVIANWVVRACHPTLRVVRACHPTLGLSERVTLHSGCQSVLPLLEQREPFVSASSCLEVDVVSWSVVLLGSIVAVSDVDADPDVCEPAPESPDVDELLVRRPRGLPHSWLGRLDWLDALQVSEGV